VSEKVNSIVIDANVAAYLVMKGFIAIPFIKNKSSEGQGSRVAWDIQGDQDAIDYEMRKYYGNEKVGILDYVRILKDIRSEMYGIKSLKGQLKEGN
jgi:hypothetical protein